MTLVKVWYRRGRKEDGRYHGIVIKEDGRLHIEVN